MSLTADILSHLLGLTLPLQDADIIYIVRPSDVEPKGKKVTFGDIKAAIAGGTVIQNFTTNLFSPIDGEDGQDGFPLPGTVGAAGSAGRDGATILPDAPEDPEVPLSLPGATGVSGTAGTPGAVGAAGATILPDPPEDPVEPLFLPGASILSATVFEADFGATPITGGKFTVTDGRISATSRVFITQAPGPYTGKGTRADEAEMDRTTCYAEPAAGQMVVKWSTIPLVTAAYPAIRLGRVRGKMKFQYMVAT